MCTSKNGIKRLKEYLATVDHEVFEPLFIAQFLFAPVNTIVKQYLLPWMMNDYPALNTEGEKYCARKIKSEVILRYTLLTELMTILESWGRKQPSYNYSNDKKLTKIMNGEQGLKGKDKRNDIICAVDGFFTIWVCTLPEKFKEWYHYHNSGY